LYHDYSISDEGIAATANSHNGSILGAKFGSTKWKLLGQARAGCYLALPTLVGNESLIVRECGELLLQTTTGVSESIGSLAIDNPGQSTTSHCEPYDGRMLFKVAAAPEGRFVALTLAATNVKKHILTEASVCLVALQVVVYDLILKTRVLTLTVDPLPKNDYDFALSPDGSKLAILNDKKVSVYSVPFP
jgi:hypothetical protein